MKVKVYSTPACSHCRDLKRFLEENGIDFQDIDVSKDREAAKEMVEKTSQLSVPVAEIDGKIIVGFKKDEIKKAFWQFQNFHRIMKYFAISQMPISPGMIGQSLDIVSPIDHGR
jgi:glutaredoxin 3